MERLTFEHDGKKCFYCGDEDGSGCECKVCSGGCAVCNPCPVEQMVIDRLAAYEDTNLTPDAAAQLKQIAEIFNCDPNDPAQLKQLCDKLRGWQQAEQAGRLKAGDTVYQTDGFRVYKYGYDFQAAQDAINREHQDKTLLQQQQWQAQQGKEDTADASQTTAQKQAYESAWNLISAGVMPSAETLTMAGINQADAQAYVAYIQRQLAAAAQKKQQSQGVYQGGGGDLDPYGTGNQDGKTDTSGSGTPGVVATEQDMRKFKSALAAAKKAGVDDSHFNNIVNSIWGKLSEQQQKEMMEYITSSLGIQEKK